MLKSLPTGQLSYLAIGLLSAGGMLFLAPRLPLALANERAVPEAELAIQPLLPQGSRVISSRRLSDREAEIWVESRSGASPVIMRLNASGVWEQDMSATLARAAIEMQTLAGQQIQQHQQQRVDLPSSFGQTAPDQPAPVPSLLETTQAVSGLIPPVNREQETQRALSGAGRVDPFVPQNIRTAEPEIALPPLPPLPVLPPSAPVPSPTPDPAAFARSVRVSGIVQIGSESFALISSPGIVPSVVQAGQNYQTASIVGVSARERRVVLTEGGENVVKTIEETTVIVGAP
ncbi:MAG: hypothetical protein ACUVRV_03795 [Cyanobacteriota bacterium]